MEAGARQSPKLQFKRAAPASAAVPIKRNRRRPPVESVVIAAISETNVVSEDEEHTETNPNQCEMHLAIIRSLEIQLKELRDKERERLTDLAEQKRIEKDRIE